MKYFFTFPVTAFIGTWRHDGLPIELYNGTGARRLTASRNSLLPIFGAVSCASFGDKGPDVKSPSSIPADRIVE